MLHINTTNILRIKGRVHNGVQLHNRFGVGTVPAGSEGRQVFEGPMVPGPWAFAFQLCTVCCSDTSQNSGAVSERNVAAGVEFDVEIGQHVMLEGVEHIIVADRNEIDLVKA